MYSCFDPCLSNYQLLSNQTYPTIYKRVSRCASLSVRLPIRISVQGVSLFRWRVTDVAQWDLRSKEVSPMSRKGRSCCEDVLLMSRKGVPIPNTCDGGPLKGIPVKRRPKRENSEGGTTNVDR